MINSTLLWLLLLPIVLAIVIFALKREHGKDLLPVLGGFLVVSFMIISVGFWLGKGTKTDDIEIWNGQVVNKERVHDTYEQSYQCNCVTTSDSKGTSTTTCQTCYETHYTVDWNCNTSVGQYSIKKLDSTSRRVYKEPDPDRFTTIQPGDPVAKRATYTNYVQAVPESLFTSVNAATREKFKGLIPAYPDNVYDFYRLNRFITPGWAPADAAQWNTLISNGLREIGPRKQVNAIIVIAKTDDPSYEYALRDAWEGANKNDVVLVIGSTQYPKIDFVRVISWTKNELFKIKLADDVMEKGNIDQSIVPVMFTHINNNFVRRQMAEFKYLDVEIDPPTWCVVIILVLVCGGAGFLIFKMDNILGSPMRRRW